MDEGSAVLKGRTVSCGKIPTCGAECPYRLFGPVQIYYGAYSLSITALSTTRGSKGLYRE